VNPNELFAADIAAARNAYIADAAQFAEAACAAHQPGWDALDVVSERLRAGERWDHDHPRYRSEDAA
jgi:hypothetical protein